MADGERHLSVMPRVEVTLGEIEAVYRRRGEDFFRFAFARTGDVEAARDAVQDGFARAIRQRWALRDRQSLEPWIARCVVNAARDRGRRLAKTNPHWDEWPSEIADPSSDPACPDEVDGRAVREALRRLPSRQRDALFLRFYLGFDYSQIAAALDMKVGTVSATLHAARAGLAARLQEVSQ